jgi:excisionase family DNA binding protein
METQGTPSLIMRDADGREKSIKMEPKLFEYVIRLLEHFENGEGVTFIPHAKKLTTQQCADILNVSRPYFIKLLEAGNIPFEKVGRHRRVIAQDLFQYQRERDAERQAAMEDLIADDGELY